MGVVQNSLDAPRFGQRFKFYIFCRCLSVSVRGDMKQIQIMLKSFSALFNLSQFGSLFFEGREQPVRTKTTFWCYRTVTFRSYGLNLRLGLGSGFGFRSDGISFRRA